MTDSPIPNDTTPNITTNSLPTFKEPLLNQLARRANIPLTPVTSYKGTTSWDELETLYQATAGALVETAVGINEAIKTFNASEIEHPEVKITIDGLKRDLESRTNKLVSLHASHEGRTGRIIDASENVQAIEIGLGYVTFTEESSVLFFQPLATLTEFLNESQQQRDALNPAVVTDLVARPVQE